MKKLALYILSLLAFISLDGITAVDSGATSEAPSAFTTVTRLTPSGIEAGDFFGYAMTATPEFTAISAPFDDERGQRTGAVYILNRRGLAFSNTATVLYPEAATQEDRFGWSVAMSGHTLVIGAPHNDKYGDDAGIAYVYRYTEEAQWALVKELVAPNPQDNQQFGWTVGITHDTVVVGSYFDADNYYDTEFFTNGAGIAQGSVFVYEGLNNWTFAQKLVPNMGQGHLWDAFGTSLAIDGAYLAVGAKGTDHTTYRAPGRVYVFHKVDQQWRQAARLQATDGQVDDLFGARLSLDDDVLAITAPGSFNTLVPSLSEAHGAAYIFKRQQEIWSEEAKLGAADTMPGDDFGGGGIALHPDYVIVGAPSVAVVTRHNGAAYLFKRELGWPESHRINAPDPLSEDGFGGSIVATEDLIFVSAHRRCNPTGCNAGALYYSVNPIVESLPIQPDFPIQTEPP